MEITAMIECTVASYPSPDPHASYGSAIGTADPADGFVFVNELFANAPHADMRGAFKGIERVSIKPSLDEQLATLAYAKYKRTRRRAPVQATARRPRARVVRRPTARKPAAKSSDDSSSEPPSVVVRLAGSHDATIAFAEQLGALAADMWLDGEFTFEVAP